MPSSHLSEPDLLEVLSIVYGGRARRPFDEESITSSCHPLSTITSMHSLSESDFGGEEQPSPPSPPIRPSSRAAAEYLSKSRWEINTFGEDDRVLPSWHQATTSISSSDEPKHNSLLVPPFPPPVSEQRMKRMTRRPSIIEQLIPLFLKRSTSASWRAAKPATLQ